MSSAEKVFAIKRKAKSEHYPPGAEAPNETLVSIRPTRLSPAEMRIKRDLEDIDLPLTIKLVQPDANEYLNLFVTICPDEGYYRRGCFQFAFNFKPTYPHDPPKVKCLQRIYHPNIDLEGNVCLNILREDWKPVLNMNSIVYGLLSLFLEPNSEDPLNKDAAKVLASNPRLFADHVSRSMRGSSIANQDYDYVMAMNGLGF